MSKISFDSESGVILLMVIIFMLALTIVGLAFLNAGVMENKLARREAYKNQAFYLAEGGLERTIWNLKQDFVNGSEDWTDGDINGVPVEDTTAEWKILQYGADPYEPALGAGVYKVKLKYVDNDEIWVRSTGIVNNIPKTVQIYVAVVNLFPWNNAIFAGIGAAGQAISGNADIHGSVLIIGDPGETAIAMDTAGTAGIKNNYKGMPDGSGPTVDLVAKVPDCPTTTFNGEPVESLDAKLRVKHGTVGLSGTATVGEEDEALNPFKETMDGVYVTDGFGGNQGTDNVYSDNDTGNPYDLGDTVIFPSLNLDYVNPITGETTPGYTHLDWLADPLTSLHITAADWAVISSGIPEISSNIEYFQRGTPGFNYIEWDKESGLLTIEGIIYIEGGSLDLGKKNETIEYEGTGTIVVAEEEPGPAISGQIIIHGDLLAQGDYDVAEGDYGFPNNALGLVTGRLDVGAGLSQLTMTGAFFAENEIVSAKQNEIAGTFISDYFDMGEQVPRIYQVPELANNLPPGMPGGTPIWYISTSQWSEVPS